MHQRAAPALHLSTGLRDNNRSPRAVQSPAVRRVEHHIESQPDLSAMTVVQQIDVVHAPPVLPAEVIAVIIDNLRNNKRTLASCSLVSKSWILLARFHLFKVLTVRREANHDGITAFLEFLCTPWGSNVCGYVRDLCIKGHTTHNVPQLDPVVNLETLGAILNKLVRLESLELMALAWPGIDPNALSMPLTSTSVKSLTLSRISMWIFDSLDEVLDILHLLPNLKTVHTNEIAWRQHLLSPAQENASRKPFPPELQLENIVLRATGVTWQLVEFSQQKLNICSLTSLSIWQLDTTDIEILGRFLHAVGSHLRHLHLKLSDVRFVDEPGYITPEDAWPLLNLQDCTALESFMIFVPMDDDPSLPGPAIDYVPYWESVEILFENLPRNLLDLRFGLEVLDKGYLRELLEEVQWTAIEGALARLPQLRSLSFFREDRHEEHFVAQLPLSIQRCIKKMLPARRQLLRFSQPGMMNSSDLDRI